MPLLPGMLLGEPPLLPAPLPLEPLRLVPLELPDAPLEPDGPQFIAVLDPPLLDRLPLLDDELLLGRLLALLPLVLELLGLLLALLPGMQSALVPERVEPLAPLGLFALGLVALGLFALGLPAELGLLCWASAVPASNTTAAQVASRPPV